MLCITAKFTGKQGDRFPYKSLEEGKIEVVGVDGVRETGSMSKSALLKLETALKEGAVTFRKANPE